MQLDRLLKTFLKTNELFNIINEDINDEDMTKKLCSVCTPTDIFYADAFRVNYLNKDALECINNSFTRVEDFYKELLSNNVDLVKFRKVATKYRYLDKDGYLIDYKRTGSRSSIILKLENLKTMYNIINSDESDLKKVNLLKDICKNLISLKMTYSFINKDKSINLYTKYKKYIDNYDKVLRTYVKYDRLKLFDNNNEYKDVVKGYINSNLILEDYLKEYDIDKNYFNKCVTNIKSNYYILYQKYTVKKIGEDKIVHDKIKHMMDELIYAVDNNKFKDDVPLTILEFIKRSPFIFNSSYYSEMHNFLEENYRYDEIKNIKRYLRINKLYSEYSYRKVTKEDLLKIKTIVNNKEMNNEDYNKIFNYLYNIGITVTNKTVSEVKKLYIKGLIK